ncbi:hypothetical protein V8F20_009537 [Naviculisporaceae sp. PSN 640]
MARSVSCFPPVEENPLTLRMIRLSQSPKNRLEAWLYNEVGNHLGFADHNDFTTWLESDEVAPFFDDFRRSWLEPETTSVSELRWRLQRGPSLLGVCDVFRGKFGPYSGSSKFLSRDTWRFARWKDQPRYRFSATRAPSRNWKRRWTAADHWAYFIMQVYNRAAEKADGSRSGVPSEWREFASLWPGAEESLWNGDAVKWLYKLLECLAKKYILERMEQDEHEKYQGEEAKGF